MKRTFAILAATAAFVTTPALAEDFAGPRIGVEAGLVDDDFLGSSEKSYGVNVGYDFDLGKAIVGVTGSYTGLFDDNADFRELGIGARVGVRVTPSTLAYTTLGYSNLDADNVPSSVDGAKVGLGLEQKFGNLYANVETRYGNYEQNVELFQTVIGVGYRF